MTQEEIELRKREKALYDIALECFEELCAPLPRNVAQSRLDHAITDRVNSMSDKFITGD